MHIPKFSPIVLFREYDAESKNEASVCKKHFVTTSSRLVVTGGDIVIGRYSVLPFYRELESDVKFKGAKLINSYREHRYVADLKNWASPYYEYNEDASIVKLTPQSWFRLEDLPDDVGPVIVKGETNSRKERWATHMFAKNKREAIEIYMKLKDDRFFEDQEIYFRKFVKFKTYFNNPINGQPITHEFRFFCYKQEILAGGFYWSNHVDDLPEVPKSSCVPVEFLKKVTDIVSQNTTFYVVDVAQLDNGEWQVVELNDGCMAGLSEVNPEELYKNLKYQLWDKEYRSL